LADTGEDPEPQQSRSTRDASALALALGVAAALVLLLLVEGMASLAAGREPAPSLVARAMERFDPRDPARRFAAPEPMLTNPSEVEALLPSLRAHRVGMGNSPYEELKTDDASVNHIVDGCLEVRGRTSRSERRSCAPRSSNASTRSPPSSIRIARCRRTSPASSNATRSAGSTSAPTSTRNG